MSVALASPYAAIEHPRRQGRRTMRPSIFRAAEFCCLLGIAAAFPNVVIAQAPYAPRQPETISQVSGENRLPVESNSTQTQRRDAAWTTGRTSAGAIHSPGANASQSNPRFMPGQRDEPVHSTNGNGSHSSVLPASAVHPVSTIQNSAPQTQTAGREVASASQATKRTPLNPTKLGSAPEKGAGSSTLQMMVSVGSSLLIVIGLFLAVAWFYRKSVNSNIGNGLPKQVVDVMGRTNIAARQQLVLVRFGPKLVLVSMVQGETRTISEIEDPLEVDRLAGMCESSKPGSISESFRSVLTHGGAA